MFRDDLRDQLLCLASALSGSAWKYFCDYCTNCITRRAAARGHPPPLAVGAFSQRASWGGADAPFGLFRLSVPRPKSTVRRFGATRADTPRTSRQPLARHERSNATRTRPDSNADSNSSCNARAIMSEPPERPSEVRRFLPDGSRRSGCPRPSGEHAEVRGCGARNGSRLCHGVRAREPLRPAHVASR